MESSAGLDQAHALLFQGLRLVFFFFFSFRFFGWAMGSVMGPNTHLHPKKKKILLLGYIFYLWHFFFFFEKVLLMTLTLIIIIFLSLILGFWYKQIIKSQISYLAIKNFANWAKFNYQPNLKKIDDYSLTLDRICHLYTSLI